jgi:small subunit ribosomal protein S15
LGDNPVAHPIGGGAVVGDPYRIARALDGCGDLSEIEVDTLDEAFTVGVALRDAAEAEISRSLAAARVAEVEQPGSQVIRPTKLKIVADNGRMPKAGVRKRAVFRSKPNSKLVGSRSAISSGGRWRLNVASDSNFSRGDLAVGVAQAERLPITASGAPEAQIAMLTDRINYMAVYFKTHAKDNHSRRRLLMLINKRRSLLNKLRKKSEERYVALIAKLGLRK